MGNKLQYSASELILQDSLDSVEGYDARVIECLQDYKDELSQPECKSQVHKLTERAGQDIRFDEPLADACFEDRARLCDDVQPVSHLSFFQNFDIYGSS